MSDNKEEKERLLTEKERKEKRSKERDKMAVEQTAKAYLDIEEEDNYNKKEGLKRGWRTRA